MKSLLVLVPFGIFVFAVLAVLCWRVVAQTRTGPIAERVGDDDPKIEFTLTDTAQDVVRQLMADESDATHLVVSVDIDDEKHAIGYKYHLALGSHPSPQDFVLTEVKSIPVAIDRKHRKFLNGTIIDWVTQESGVNGFTFDNPTPVDVRLRKDVSVDQTKHIDPAVEVARLMTPERDEAYERLRFWWLANQPDPWLLSSEKIGLVEKYTADGETIYVIFSGEPGKRKGGVCLVNDQGRILPIFSNANYLADDDRFVDVNGDGIPEIIMAFTIGGGSRPEEPHRVLTDATKLIILDINQAHRPLLQVLFDKRKAGEPEHWTWQLDDSSNQGSTIRLHSSPDGPSTAEFVWQPAEKAFAGPAGSPEEGFVADFGSNSLKEKGQAFLQPDD